MFNESIFIKCLAERPEDARFIRQVFKSEWLNTVQYRPILDHIFSFVDRHNLPPSIQTLHQIMKDEDETMYKARHKKVLDELEKVQYDISNVIYTLSKAKDVAMSRSFRDLYTSAYMADLLENDDGVELLKEVEKWKLQFYNSTDETELDIKEALQKIVKDNGFMKKNEPIPCGIEVLDTFAGGGIKPKNLAIVIAPSKNGKSITLMNIAYNIAAVAEKNVLFITNELTTEETTERFLSRMTGLPNSEIQKDISVVLGNPRMERHWELGLHNRLRLVENISEFSSDYIESVINKYVSLYSWKPDAIVIDYMERMRPTVKGIRHSDTWDWLGYVARDLARLSKRVNCLVWTAAQTNRSGFDRKNSLGAASAQGSIKHLQEAAFVVGQRKRKTHDGVVFEFEPILVRHAEDSSRVFVNTTLGEMRIGERVELDPMDFLDVEEKAWGKKSKE